MGLDLPSVQMLCCAKSLRADFSKTLMIGRQTISEDAETLASPLSAVGISESDIRTLKKGEFGEALFQMLGATLVESLDASDYEQATYVHDLNRPSPPHLSQKFTVVYDGGTLEHVFNLPQAFKASMEMVRLGGHFIQVNVANNFMGHGFWQFGPETIYRIFSAENGFLIKIVLLHEVVHRGGWYLVSDPSISRGRAELVNNCPTYICTMAQRVSLKDVFARYPQQSDYVTSWKRLRGSPNAQSPKPRSIREMIPQSVKRFLRSTRDVVTARSPFDRPYYRRVSESDLVRGRIST